MKSLPGLTALVALLIGTVTAWSAPLDLYIAVDGNDTWSGKLAAPNADKTDGPLATLTGARDAIRRVKRGSGDLPSSVVVHIRAGDYVLDQTFELTAEDSGSERMPIVYRAYQNEKVRLIGGREITNFESVTEASILKRVDDWAANKLLQADLKKLGVTDLGEATTAGKRIELFFDDKPMMLARWPNEGFTTIAEVVGGQPTESHGLKGDKVGKFTYQGDRPRRWAGENEIWLHGYWFWDWADAYQKVESIDVDKRTIATVPPYHHYGYRAGQRYYAVNLLSEIDWPGEWYLDRQTGILYFWPPAEIGSARAFVSVLGTLILMKDVSHVTIRGLTLSFNRGTAIAVQGGAHNRVAACTLRNIGGQAVVVNGGQDHAVMGCDIYNCGDGGISLTGGDRKSLTPCGHAAINNHIHHYSRTSNTYRTAVSVAGVGCRVANNLIHDAPHMALGLSGNDHVIEFNEVHHVCMDTDDAGAFYMGRDWTWRSNTIRYNYFHHIGQFKSHVGTQAVYLDDWASDTTVFGNICYKVHRAILVGGGRDNEILNNVIVDCPIGIHVDSRGLGWAKSYFDQTDNTLIQRLKEVPYKEPPWSQRYPELLKLYDDEPALAKYNKLERNIIVGCGKPIDLHDGLTDKVVSIKDNLIDQDPGFVDRAKGDFRLSNDSPAFKLGFQPIPIDKIGPYQDDLRASWPVRQ